MHVKTCFMSRIYAISDIHGCFRTFYELLIGKIGLKKTDRLILLGDYIDRGDESREVVDFIIELIKDGFDVRPLTGNHEQMLLKAYEDPEMIPLWYMNSGQSTMVSFGISDIRDIKQEYLRFLKELPFYEKTGDYLFVHAGFNDHITDPFSDKYSMVWECSPKYENPLLMDKIIIHGHRPKKVDYIRSIISSGAAVIPIDTGCVYDMSLGYGYLSALELTSMELISIPCQSSRN